MPNRTSVSLPPSRDRTTLCSSSTEPSAKTKAFAETIQLAGTPGTPMSRTIASAAPKIAADDMPSVNGLASGLLSDRLHLGAGQRQRRADEEGHHRVRHADVPDDDGNGRTQRFWAEDAGESVTDRQVGGAGDEIQEKRPADPRKQHREHEQAASQELLIPCQQLGCGRRSRHQS